MIERDTVVQELKNIEREINEISGRAGDFLGNMGDELSEGVAGIRDRTESLVERLESARGAGEAVWNKTKHDARKDVEEIKNTWNKLQKEIV